MNHRRGDREGGQASSDRRTVGLLAGEQLAIVLVLARDGVTSAIIGATKVKQLEENCAALEFELSDKDFAEIDTLFPAAEHP